MPIPEPVIIGNATLYCGDCLELLPHLTGVDAVVTDPPYGQTNEKYDYDVSQQVWQLCFAAVKDNGMILSFAGAPTYHRIASKIETSGWKVRQMWMWIYNDGMMISAWPRDGYDRLAPAFDPICYATKGKILLNVRREGVTQWRRHRKLGEPNTYADNRVGTHGASSGKGKYPRTVISECGVPKLEYFVQSRTSPKLRNEAVSHPNQKPECLMTWLVDKTPIGATVLDPFAGSGSTGVACIRTGRKFIGIEIDPDYFAIACARIEKAQRQIRMEFEEEA